MKIGSNRRFVVEDGRRYDISKIAKGYRLIRKSRKCYVYKKTTKKTMTFSECSEISKNYTSITSFKRHERYAFRMALENGWLELFDWLNTNGTFGKSSKWTLERFLNEMEIFQV